MATTVLIFPFDLFGSPGTGAGAQLLGDEIREMLADNRRETATTRAQAYMGKVQVREAAFEDLAAYQDWRKHARRLARPLLHQGHFFFWLTGNHLGVLPLYEELGQHEGSLVCQFDAHLDIHHFAACTPHLSHGNFLLHGEGPLPPVINLGHRELLLPPHHVRRYYQSTVSALELAADAARAKRKVRQATKKAQRILLDIDCDVLDPAFFPAVSHPVPFGLAPGQLLDWINTVWSEQVIGLALSEFDPARDRQDEGLALLMWLIEYLLLKRYESKG
jgi:arginase family enzyme